MKKTPSTPFVIEPPYFSNWADQVYPKLANKLLPVATKVPGLTPNIVTISSFVLYVLGCLALFINFPYHLIFTAIALPVAYVLDCLDGQLARTTKHSSVIGDYLDKTLDVLKIYVITISLAIAMYMQTQQVLYIFLGFTACFFFNFRYYIKLETMFSAVNRDKDYLTKSREKRYELYETFGKKYKTWSKTFGGKVKTFLHKNRAIFAVDEAEFVTFTAIAALFNQLGLVLWIFAISQTVFAFWRLYERGAQIQNFSDRLFWPMRK
jgi:phosphatidylglycerophosphate synthase